MKSKNKYTGVGILLLLTSNAVASINIFPSAGYEISWNGNDGDFFNQNVPDNLALSSNGSVAISSGNFGDVVPFGYHLLENVNDGEYGNNASWLGVPSDPAPWFAGVIFPEPINISSIAFGRDNGNAGVENMQFFDRSEGTYTLQYTVDTNNWISIGSLNYSLSGDDGIVGGTFSSYYRHEFGVSTELLQPIQASGFRILTSSAELAIDEIEVYGSAIPEPSSAFLLGLASLAFIGIRRKMK